MKPQRTFTSEEEAFMRRIAEILKNGSSREASKAIKELPAEDQTFLNQLMCDEAVQAEWVRIGREAGLHLINSGDEPETSTDEESDENLINALQDRAEVAEGAGDTELFELLDTTAYKWREMKKK